MTKAMLPPTTRASLLMQLQNSGDREAWCEFAALYEPAVFRMLRRSGLQEADALEIQQEVMLAVSRNIHRWKTGSQFGSFRGWLGIVTRNLLISWIRKRKTEGVFSVTGLDSWLFAEIEADSPETREFELEVRRAAFQRASQEVQREVSPQAWLAFWKTAVENKSFAETAQELGISEGAVRVAKCRVLARLRARAQQWEGVE